MLEVACAEANVMMLAKYDAVNPAALKRLYANKVQLRPFSREIMQAAYKASHEVYAEEAAKNPKFKKVYTAWRTFRNDQVLWFRVAEQNFDNFMATAASESAGQK
jgi:TRAP-type mannitol/chloroaromatic compound transport system substrate-binding protein